MNKPSAADIELAYTNLRRVDESAGKPSVFYPLQPEPPLREGLRTDIQIGMIAEDCALHIGKVVHVDPMSGDVRIESMFDGITRGCDLYHCGVIEQTPEQVKLKTELFKTGGMKALSDHYHEQEEIWIKENERGTT